LVGKGLIFVPTATPEALSWRLERLEKALDAEIARRERECADMENEIKVLREKTDVRERNLFIAGITFLGGIILTLIGVLWANLGAIFPGRG
jgi:hypothetical protein